MILFQYSQVYIASRVMCNKPSEFDWIADKRGGQVYNVEEGWTRICLLSKRGNKKKRKKKFDIIEMVVNCWIKCVILIFFVLKFSEARYSKWNQICVDTAGGYDWEETDANLILVIQEVTNSNSYYKSNFNVNGACKAYNLDHYWRDE
jgi:hypothetical protein